MVNDEFETNWLVRNEEEYPGKQCETGKIPEEQVRRHC